MTAARPDDVGPTPRRVLVLGGHGEIGSAIADLFRERGDVVVSTGRAEIDLASPPSIDRFFAIHSNSFEVLVHSAGINNPKPFDQLTREDINTVFEVNLGGFLGVLKHIEPHLRKQGGRVLAISSIYGFLSRHGRLPYAVSKHGLVGAIKTLAIELGRHGVLVNSLSPGFIATRLTEKNNTPAAELCIGSQLDLKFVLPSNMREARAAHHFQVLSRQLSRRRR